MDLLVLTQNDRLFIIFIFAIKADIFMIILLLNFTVITLLINSTFSDCLNVNQTSICVRLVRTNPTVLVDGVAIELAHTFVSLDGCLEDNRLPGGGLLVLLFFITRYGLLIWALFLRLHGDTFG